MNKNGKREKLVRKLVKQEVSSVIYGYENEVMDGNITETDVPEIGSLVEEIYLNVVREDSLDVGSGFRRVEKDIRFLGTERMKEIIREEIERIHFL